MIQLVLDKHSHLMESEIVIPLPWGGTLRCGEGDSYEWGSYVRVCDENNEEIPGCYWISDEWRDDPEAVMGAIFGSTIKKVEKQSP